MKEPLRSAVAVLMFVAGSVLMPATAGSVSKVSSSPSLVPLPLLATTLKW